MPNRKEHNIDCVNKGNPFNICDETSEYMDYPSKINPGCGHRAERHDPETCIYLMSRGRTYEEKSYYFNACEAHRDLDRANSYRCGCSGLYKEFSRDNVEILSLEPNLNNSFSPNYDFLLYEEPSLSNNNIGSDFTCSLRDHRRNTN